MIDGDAQTTPIDGADSPKSPSVLLVDDNRSNLIALSAVLQPLNARLVEASSGAQALALLEHDEFAVVVLDVQMPEMDGFEVATRIRAMESGRELPIIFLTAIHRDERFARKGYATGAADYITKPYDPHIVRARVGAFVDLFRQREAVRRAQLAVRTHERDDAVRRLVAFERIATAALGATDLQVFLRELLPVFMSAAEAADSVTILLRHGDELRAHAVFGLNEEVDERFSVRIGEGFAGLVAAGGKPLELGNALDSPLVENGWIRSRGTKALYGVPLMHDGEVVGVAHIGSTSQTVFPIHEKRLFGALAQRAAWAVAQHLRRSRMHDVLSSASAVVAIVGVPSLKFEFANPAYRELLGGTDLIGVAVQDANVSPEVVAVVERVRDREMIVDLAEVHLQAETGLEVERLFRLTAQPLRNHAGLVDSVFMFAVDVTDQVRARREIEASQRERARLLELEREARLEAELSCRTKDEFLATVSHELRTPLSAILGWTLMARSKATPELDRLLAIVERNARTQARMIEDLLDTSRSVSGTLRIDRTEIALGAIVEGALDAVRPAADAKGIAIAASIDPLATLRGDAGRLQQVVWNLLSNAIKFSSRGGHVVIEASRLPDRREGGPSDARSGSGIVIRVSDQGQGIAPEFLPHVFEPFRQGDASTTRRHGGLGLGLSIVHQLVAAHGGTIVAASEGVGKGATFTVELPAQSQEDPNAERDDSTPPSSAPTDDVRLEGLKVLVVDDDDDARLLLKEVFVGRGASVAEAASADEGLTELVRFRPDVLVSDIAMPGGDGYGLIRAVRALSADGGGRTPAIAVTAHAQDVRSEPDGFHAHLAKPVNLGRLVSLVANLGGRA